MTLTLTIYRKGCTLKLGMSILHCVFDMGPHRLPEGCTLKLNIQILRSVFDIDPHRLPEGLHPEIENERPYNDFETSESRSTIKNT